MFSEVIIPLGLRLINITAFTHLLGYHPLNFRVFRYKEGDDRKEAEENVDEHLNTKIREAV